MKSPILLIVFNRVESAKKVFDAVRLARPKKLYIVADGPRKNIADDSDKCRRVRDIVSQVDWPCEVFKIFRDDNRGTKYGIAEAINWFFEQEEEGIILEDDIVPLPSFFQFCDEMLNYYRDNVNVSVISGNNSIAPYCLGEESYFFTKYTFLWGWASWRRAWKHFDITMKNWPEWKESGGLKKISDGNIYFEYYWQNLLDTVYTEQLNTCWDYQWLFNNWQHGFLSVMPKNNLITNIGFGAGATHTKSDIPEYLIKAEPKDILFPIVHPQKIVRDINADKLFDKVVINLNFKPMFLSYLKKSFLGPFLLRVKRKFFS